jgi:hypothetical protein
MLSKKGAYMLWLVLGYPDVMVFLQRLGHHFILTPAKPSSEFTKASFSALNLSQLLDKLFSVRARIPGF